LVIIKTELKGLVQGPIAHRKCNFEDERRNFKKFKPVVAKPKLSGRRLNCSNSFLYQTILQVYLNMKILLIYVSKTQRLSGLTLAPNPSIA
jgi:hypothetical protein